MKKLLVLALAAIMVLSFAVASMAAVTVGGEVNFGWNLTSATDTNKTTMADFADAKISATAAINDEVTAFAALKGANANKVTATISGTDYDVATPYSVVVDEAWVKFTEGFGTVKVGYFGWNVKENLDLINQFGDLKNNAGINVVGTPSDAITVDFFTAQPQDKNAAGDDNSGGFLYGLKVKYAADVFGASLGYAKASYAKDAENEMSLNGYYKLGDATTFYMNYVPEGKYDGSAKTQSAIIGAYYDKDKIYFRVETDIQPTKDTQSATAIRVGYRLNGAELVLTNKNAMGVPTGNKNDATTEIKLKCAF